MLRKRLASCIADLPLHGAKLSGVASRTHLMITAADTAEAKGLHRSNFYEEEAAQSEDESVSSDEEDGAVNEYEQMDPDEV